MKFNPTKYQPGSDSTKAHAKRANQEGVLIIEITRTKGEDGRMTCLDGCGGVPKGKNANFLMGHDARLKGMLMRAHVTGTKVVEIVEGREESTTTAIAIAKRHGWQRVLTDAQTRLNGKADAAKARAAARKVAAAKKSASKKSARKTTRKTARKGNGKATPATTPAVETGQPAAEAIAS